MGFSEQTRSVYLPAYAVALALTTYLSLEYQVYSITRQRSFLLVASRDTNETAERSE